MKEIGSCPRCGYVIHHCICKEGCLEKYSRTYIFDQWQDEAHLRNKAEHQLIAKEEEIERLKAENEELKNKLKLATLFIKNNLETVSVINELKSLMHNPERLDGEK